MAVGCMILILAFRLLAELMLDGSSQFFMYFIYFLHVLAGLFAALLYFILGVIRLIQKDPADGNEWPCAEVWRLPFCFPFSSPFSSLSRKLSIKCMPTNARRWWSKL